jgi:hypothetical protein
MRGIILRQGRLFPPEPIKSEGHNHHAMKFGEKYELLESLTTGAIETFVANDRVRSERVLVHIVDCAPQKPDQSTAEWVLESFHRLVPESPGPVLETGKYTGTKYAYVVTRPVDESAVKAWVRRYEFQAQETKETRIHSLKTEIMAVPAVPPPATPVPPAVAPPVLDREPRQPAGQMTQLFRDFDSLAKSKAPVPPEIPRPAPMPSTSLPGESGLHTAVPWDPANARVAAPPKEVTPAGLPSYAKPLAPELPSPGATDRSKPGEFTSFFQGPFRPESQSDMPQSDMPRFASEPIDPPRKTVGEFTAVFGQASPAPATTGADASRDAGPSFTGIFKDMETAKPDFNSSTPMQGGVLRPEAPVRPMSPMNMTPVADPVFAAPVPIVVPAPPMPAMPPPPSVPIEKAIPPRASSPPGDGATGVFRQPQGPEPAAVAAEVPAGPSPYTQIISRSRLGSTEGGAAGQASGSAGSKFAAPSMPKIPAAAPATPKSPAPPPMPKIAAPAAPKTPKIDAPATPAVSFWPLIVTLAVLFLLALLLVLYFVLKH